MVTVVVTAPARKERLSMSLLEARKIGNHILDLLGSEDGLALEIPGDPREAVHTIVGRHDRVRIETRRISQPQTKLIGRRARSCTREGRREVALEALLGNRRAMAQQAQPD